MSRNVVLCADGTCNAFGRSSSNVARLLELVELRADVQVVAYDQGIGTRLGEHRHVRRFRDRLGSPRALVLLDPPRESLLRPWTWRSLVRAMAYGDGIDAHVGKLYAALSVLHRPGDRVYLFGFSRGAFAVRALAGLVWRYGLPVASDAAHARARFAEAWRLFENEFPDEDGTAAARAARFRDAHGHRPCRIHFLGLWDTVKSYGGLQPVMLPHLRHNPSVSNIRHALALDEQRAWFEPTTWGWLDSDQKEGAAASRLGAEEIDEIRRQNVAEVWFAGCHSDIGGGGRNRDTAAIALRWMLGEAHDCDLVLNDAGKALLSLPPEAERPQVEPSRTLFWKIVERRPRLAIDNKGRWPARVIAPPGASPRRPLDAVRGKTLRYHESVTDVSRFAGIPDGIAVETQQTRRNIQSVAQT